MGELSGSNHLNLAIVLLLCLTIFQNVSCQMFFGSVSCGSAIGRKLFIFDSQQYSNWSNWSECDESDCTQFRYRECVDESWEDTSAPCTMMVTNFASNLDSQEVSVPSYPTSCPVKYIAERQSCDNKTMCLTEGPVPNPLTGQCGKRPDSASTMPKVYGGDTAKPNSWPWHVGLALRSDGHDKISLCGGTLISPRWVVTAAHCITGIANARKQPLRPGLRPRQSAPPHHGRKYGHSSVYQNKKQTYYDAESSRSRRRQPESMSTSRVPFGVLFNLSSYAGMSNIDVIVGDHHREITEPSERRIRASQAILHPKYLSGVTTHGYDIALVKLDEPVPEEKFQPACLPDGNFSLPPGTDCVALGWGEREGPRTPIMRRRPGRLFTGLPFFGMSNFDSIFSDLLSDPFSIMGKSSSKTGGGGVMNQNNDRETTENRPHHNYHSGHHQRHRHHQNLRDMFLNNHDGNRHHYGHGHNRRNEEVEYENYDDTDGIEEKTIRTSDFYMSPYNKHRWPSILQGKKVMVLSKELREVNLPIQSLQKCSQRFDNLKQGVHICAGVEGKDTCKGDSGGGLFCKAPGTDNWHLYGITSYGGAAGCGRTYSIYMSVPAASDWIKRVISRFSNTEGTSMSEIESDGGMENDEWYTSEE